MGSRDGFGATVDGEASASPSASSTTSTISSIPLMRGWPVVVPASGRGSTTSVLVFKVSVSVTRSKTSSPALSSNSICNGSSVSPSKSSSEVIDSASLVELELD